MEKVEVRIDNNQIKVKLPLTQPSGKVRVKRRTFFGAYGIPVAVRHNNIGQSDYIEWQIGYDFEKSDKSRKSLINETFINYKGEVKVPYELSEILKYSYDLNLLDQTEIQKTYDEIKKINCFFDQETIKRSNPKLTSINGLDFYEMTVEYPMFVNKYDNYEIYTEIINREKQRAIGVQPMLFLCIPLTSLDFKKM